MSIKGIKPGQVIPFPNQKADKKAEKSVENSEFDKTLDKASVAEQKSDVCPPPILDINSDEKLSLPQPLLPWLPPPVT